MKLLSIIGVVHLFCAFAITGSVRGDIVTYSITGIVNNTSDVPSPDYIGGNFSLTFSIEAPGTDSAGANDKGTYEGQTTGVFSIVSLGGGDTYVGTLETLGDKQKLEIKNKGGGDEFELENSFTGDDMNFLGTDVAPTKIHFHVKDGSALAFDSDAIPTFFPSAYWFDEIKDAKIEFGAGGGKRELFIDIASFSISSIPEPGSFALLSIATVGLCWMGRRKKSI